MYVSRCVCVKWCDINCAGSWLIGRKGRQPEGARALGHAARADFVQLELGVVTSR